MNDLLTISSATLEAINRLEKTSGACLVLKCGDTIIEVEHDFNAPSAAELKAKLQTQKDDTRYIVYHTTKIPEGDAGQFLFMQFSPSVFGDRRYIANQEQLRVVGRLNTHAWRRTALMSLDDLTDEFIEKKLKTAA